MNPKDILRLASAQALIALPFAAVGSDYQDAEEIAPTSAQNATTSQL